MLTKSQISLIKKRIQQEGVKTVELAEDLLDHFCVAIEQQVAQGSPFQLAFDQVFATLQEDELKITEMKTQELLEGKKVFYPDLFQSFLLVLSALFFSWLAFQAAQAVAIGIEDLEMRKQWFEQNYLLIIGFSEVSAIGIPIGYTIWRKRQTQINLPIFSFRTVPVYAYGVILPIGFLSLFWLEPLNLFSVLPRIGRELEIPPLENFDPLVVMLVSIGSMIFLELLFRGIILKGLLMTMTPLKAIFWSSLFCGLLLYPYFVAIFLLSWMLGWIYWKTSSLYTAIIFTIVGYLTNYTILQLMGFSGSALLRFTWWDYVNHNLLIYLPLVIGSLLLTAGLLYYLNRRLKAESRI
ncbi:MAG: CPBP family intramembrane glutamic endopeptidase [Bacteroidota bacterium]